MEGGEDKLWDKRIRDRKKSPREKVESLKAEKSS